MGRAGGRRDLDFGTDSASFRDSRVNGLTSCQFDMKIAFFVPWTVVGNTTEPDYVAKDKTNAAQQAERKNSEELKAATSELKAKQTELETIDTKAKTEAVKKRSTK